MGIALLVTVHEGQASWLSIAFFNTNIVTFDLKYGHHPSGTGIFNMSSYWTIRGYP
jgi:hypothetical protein